MKWLIKGGRVVDPAGGTDRITDVLVDQGKIVAVADGLTGGEGVEVIDASGKIIAPGLVDMHVHLRDPGYEAKETIATGTRAAAAGGFTGIACMPNTQPVADSAAVITYIRTRAREEGTISVYPIGAITKGSQGEELAEIGDLVNAGAVGISDDGRPVMNGEIMRRALQYSAMFQIPVIVHCEDLNLVAGGVMHEGRWSTVLGLKGIPAAAEEVMVARDLILAEETGGRLHIAHASTAGTVRLIREAKGRGVAVTAEVTPHHLILGDDAVDGYNTATKVNPPLRTAADREALIEGLADGTIDVIATDHAPHTSEDKDQEYDYAPFGMVGLETAVPLVVTLLVSRGRLTWSQAVTALSYNPCRVLGLPGGTLRPGSVADLVIIDPDLEEQVDTNKFNSRGKNSPFHGWKLKGWPVLTMVAGMVVARGSR
ncbi:MAG: dihydroorotase [Bacillota bacterium]